MSPKLYLFKCNELLNVQNINISSNFEQTEKCFGIELKGIFHPFNIDPAFTLVTSAGTTCNRIYIEDACEEAARQLGISDTSSEDDGQNGVSHDPPFCYYEGGNLKFNHFGTNTGTCTSSDKCLCIAGSN